MIISASDQSILSLPVSPRNESIPQSIPRFTVGRSHFCQFLRVFHWYMVWFGGTRLEWSLVQQLHIAPIKPEFAQAVSSSWARLCSKIAHFVRGGEFYNASNCCTIPWYVCWTISLLRCCTALLLHCCTIALLHRCTVAPLHHCTVAPLHRCTIAPLHCTVALLHSIAVVLLHWRTVALLHCCTIALLHYCTVAPLHCCTVAQLHRCTVA